MYSVKNHVSLSVSGSGCQAVAAVVISLDCSTLLRGREGGFGKVAQKGRRDERAASGDGCIIGVKSQERAPAPVEPVPIIIGSAEKMGGHRTREEFPCSQTGTLSSRGNSSP